MLDIDKIENLEIFPNYLQYLKLSVINSSNYLIWIYLFFLYLNIFSIFFSIFSYLLVVFFLYKIDLKIFHAFQIRLRKENK